MAFSSNGIDLTVDGDGHLELNEELEPRNFIETAEGELTAQPSAVTIDKAGYSGISINGLAEATPYQLMKGRRYGILTLYAQPFTDAPEGYVWGIHPGAHFDVAGTGNVIPHGTPSQETFESVGPDPDLRKTLRARVLTVTPQLNGYPDLLNVYGVGWLQQATPITVLRGRRYRLAGWYSYGLVRDDAFFSPGNDLSIDQNGGVTFSAEAAHSLTWLPATSTLAAKAGVMTIMKTGYNGQVSVSGHATAIAEGTSPLTTVLVLGRKYRILPSDTMVTMSPQGVCTPTWIDVPGGRLDIVCSDAVVSPPGFCANKPNGTACQDGNACTGTDSCQNDLCAPGSPTSDGTACGNQGVCGAGVCASPSGFCNDKPNAECEDGSTCTNQDACNAAGVCVGVPLANNPACSSAPPDPPTLAADPLVGGAFNGVLKGDLSVSPSGAAIYTLPISIPPGVAGMAPNLSLVYNSQAGNGIAGQGWELTGSSMIHRCPKTRAQDGQARPVDLGSGDGLCLDGQRLFRTGSTYYLESEQFVGVTVREDSSIPSSYQSGRSKSSRSRVKLECTAV